MRPHLDLMFLSLPLTLARLSAAAALKHPFFWTVDKKMHFLLDVSDRIETVRALVVGW
jgi:hypothetical protein